MIAHRTVFRRFLAELVLVVGMLAGCAGADGGDSFSQIQADENVQDIPERQDVPRIVVTYQTYQGSVLTDLDEVADAINEITVPEIGVEVSFRLVDAASPHMATYEGETGVAYLDFVAEDPTSTLTFYYNGRYMDLVSMMVEGSWTMAEGAGGYEYTLTPDSDSDTGAVVAVASDEQTCTYTPEDGEAVSMTNVRASGPAETMTMTGTTPIPGQETQADIKGSLYDDGTVRVVASAFGSEIELDAGTWSMGDDGYTVTFQFDNAGELVSGLGESGAALQYVAASEMLGDIDAELVIAIAE